MCKNRHSGLPKPASIKGLNVWQRSNRQNELCGLINLKMNGLSEPRDQKFFYTATRYRTINPRNGSSHWTAPLVDL